MTYLHKCLLRETEDIKDRLKKWFSCCTSGWNLPKFNERKDGLQFYAVSV